MYLDAIQTRFESADTAQYPFNLPLWDGLDELSFTTPVTFFVGDNGTGKSTLLEATAVQFSLPALTQASVDRHPLMQGARDLAKALRFVRRPQPRRKGRGTRRHGFFFRADDVTGFAQGVRAAVAEHESLEQHFEATLEGYGRTLATGSARAQHAAMTSRYGDNPFANSHGELFLMLLRNRLTVPGLYLLDEPETPLSPTNQIALLALLLDAANQGSQIIVATHSPILMALPGATIFDFDQHPPAPIAWEDAEHVSITRAFLSNPQAFLRHL